MNFENKGNGIIPKIIPVSDLEEWVNGMKEIGKRR